jgi:hypothetical protein
VDERYAGGLSSAAVASIPTGKSGNTPFEMGASHDPVPIARAMPISVPDQSIDPWTEKA